MALFSPREAVFGKPRDNEVPVRIEDALALGLDEHLGGQINLVDVFVHGVAGDL